MNLDNVSAMHLLEVMLQGCVIEEWREFPDVFSEEGKHSPIYIVCFVQVAGDFFSLLLMFFCPPPRTLNVCAAFQESIYYVNQWFSKCVS